MTREAKMKELQMLDSARRKFMNYTQQQKETELARLDDDIRRKVVMTRYGDDIGYDHNDNNIIMNYNNDVNLYTAPKSKSHQAPQPNRTNVFYQLSELFVVFYRSQRSRQTVPDSWDGDCERSITEPCPCPW